MAQKQKAMARSSALEEGVRAILDTAVKRRGLSRRSVVIGLIGLAAVTFPASSLRVYARSGAAAEGEAIVLPGRVVAREGDRPVAGAEVVVRVGTAEETSRTDAAGRFSVRIPPDQRTELAASVSVTVRHPDYIPKTGFGSSVADLLALRSRGEPQYFDTIRLDPGVEFTGEVVRPDGSPAAALDLWFQNWGGSDSPREPHFSAETKVRTDARGRFRLRMWKTMAVEINATPDDLAPLQRFIGHDRPAERPGYSVPADLGRFVLDDGIRAAGRLLDVAGRPIAGERLEIRGRIRVRITRGVTTAPDGSFTFGPLQPGSYTVQAERQGRGGGVNWSVPPLPPPDRAIRPVKVILEAGGRAEPIEVREVPTVTVSCRFVDGKGRPAKGGPVTLCGLIPDKAGKADPFEVAGAGMRRASTVNEPELEDKSTRLDWGVQAVCDPGGKLVFAAPKGLRHASLETHPPDGGTSIKTRLRDTEPLKYWGGGQLGDLTEDVSGVTFVYYRAPTVVATVEAEGGQLPEELIVGESFIGPSGGSYGGRFERQADGRFRSRSLMPDHVYDIRASARGWLWTRVRGVTLPEGGHAEVRLTLRKKPDPLQVGDLAPELDIKGLNGKPLRLADYRGKVVLLDLWRPWSGPDDGDLPFLKSVRSRFGNHPQFALIGLSGGPKRADAENNAANARIDWLRGVLEYETGDSPLPSLYGADGRSAAVLIGPDGRIVAMGLHGAEIYSAVANVLGP